MGAQSNTETQKGSNKRGEQSGSLAFPADQQSQLQGVEVQSTNQLGGEGGWRKRRRGSRPQLLWLVTVEFYLTLFTLFYLERVPSATWTYATTTINAQGQKPRVEAGNWGCPIYVKQFPRSQLLAPQI